MQMPVSSALCHFWPHMLHPTALSRPSAPPPLQFTLPMSRRHIYILHAFEVYFGVLALHFNDEPSPETRIKTLVVGQFPPFLASPPPNIMSSGCWDMTNVRRGGPEGVMGKASMQVDTGCPILPRRHEG